MTLRTCLLCACLLGAIATKAESGAMLDFRLSGRDAETNPFTSSPTFLSEARRVFPGETIHGGVTLRAHEGVATIDSAALAQAIEPRVVQGDISSELATGSQIPAGVGGITWSVGVNPDCQHDGCAEVIGSNPSLAPGTYSFIVLLNNPALASALGSLATTEMRTNLVRLNVGPTTNEEEEMWSLLRKGDQALDAGNWALAEQNASAVLALHPKSVLAFLQRADAKLGAGDSSAALAALNAAKSILEAGQDTRTPMFEIPAHRDGYLGTIKEKIRELSSP